jgi:hypothetical protein
MRRTNDILWKGMLEEVFDDLLRFLFPKADRIFNLDRGFEFLDKELAEMYPQPEKRSDTRFVDKLVKVYTRDGSEEWILAHVEVQGRHDPFFAKRMFKYYCRIFDRFDRPVTAIAIFTGRDGKKLPDTYERSYFGAMLTYKYNTLCILNYNDKQLIKSNNPFAMVILAAQKALIHGKDLDNELLQQKLLIAKLLYRKGFKKKKVHAILSFLHNYVRFAKPVTNYIFEKKLDKITGKPNTMGIIEQLKEIKLEEARKEGRTEEQVKVVKRLLAKKFSTKEISSIAGVSSAFVEKTRKGSR